MDIKKAVRGALKHLKPGKSIATPEDNGPRTVVTEPVANNLTPDRLARILKEAVEGDPADFFELAQEMEERDGHYGSVLATRKLTILGIAPELHAASEDPKDEQITEAVREDVLNHPEFGFLLGDLLDALGKGIAVVEIGWDTSDVARWKPSSFDWVDPRWLQFDKKTRREVRLKAKDIEDGLELPELSYIQHRPRLKSGLPIRGGLARLAVWSWMLKSYTMKDWAAFCEIFGQPLRLGRYGPGASDKDKRALLRAVRSIARDAAAIIPSSMDMELIQTKASGGAVFKDFAEFLDGQVSKAVLGQTMTTDDGSSMAQAEVHDGVRMDIAQADARTLSHTINAGLIIPYCKANFGALDTYPTFKLEIEEPEDLDLASKVLERLINAGIELAADEVRDKFGYRAPEGNEDTIGGVAKTDEGDEQETDTEPEPKAKTATNRIAANTEHPHAADAALDNIIALGMADWRDQGDPMLGPIEAALNRSQSYAEFLRELPKLIGEQNMGPLTDALAGATTLARATGEAEDS